VAVASPYPSRATADVEDVNRSTAVA